MQTLPSRFATARVRRIRGTTALPLLRVHPEVVSGRTVPAQFAGSIFDLKPATLYEIELHAVDPDGAVDQTLSVMATTRPVPRAEPANAHAKSVSDAAGLKAALSAAQPGDVITLANGTYAGPFEVQASGTENDPIVVRGESEEGVVLDGGGCTGCNVLEVYGSFVHIERLTIAHATARCASRARRGGKRGAARAHQGHDRSASARIPIRRISTSATTSLEGRLVVAGRATPTTGARTPTTTGSTCEGTGHVICHNQLVGFGDAMKTEQDGARSVDFYGNEVLSGVRQRRRARRERGQRALPAQPLHQHLRDHQLPAHLRRARVRGAQRGGQRGQRADEVPRARRDARPKSRAACSSTTTRS